MVFTWTKQFLMATGLFALVLTGQTLTVALKQDQLAKKQLSSSPRTVHMSQKTQFHLN